MRKISYTTVVNRTLPLRISAEQFDPSNPVKIPAAVTTFHNFKTFNGSPADFSMAHFGLPEPGRPTTNPQMTSRWYLWFLLGAAVSLVAGIFFWHRAKRQLNAKRLNRGE